MFASDIVSNLILTSVFGGVAYLAVKAFSRGPQAKVLPITSPQHCMTCGEDSALPTGATSAKRGNNTLEIVLWVFLLWPIALVYSVWRRIGTGVKPTCPVCNASTLVPVHSAAARAHQRQLEASGG